MEDGLARMIVTGFWAIFLQLKCLACAATICAVVLGAVTRHWRLQVLVGCRCSFLLLFFSIKVCRGTHLSYLLIANRCRGVSYRRWLPKSSVTSFRVVCMRTSAAAYNFLELIPLPRDLITALPTFLKIVEYWFTRVELALRAVIISIIVLFVASRSFTPFSCYLDHCRFQW